MAEEGRWQRALHYVRDLLPPVNFITLHYIYFIATSLIFSVIFWASATPHGSVTYLDALFLVISAVTEAGLNTINLSTINTWQQVQLFFLMILGSAIWVSISVVQFRKRAFLREFSHVIRVPRSDETASQKALPRMTSRTSTAVQSDATDPEQHLHTPGTSQESSSGPELNQSNHHLSTPTEIATTSSIKFEIPASDRRRTQGTVNLPRHRSRASIMSNRGVGVHPDAQITAIRPRLSLDERPSIDHSRSSFATGQVEGRIGRNSSFHGLNEHERDRLGGVEYEALSLLGWLVPTYFVLWQLLGSLALGAYIARYRRETAVQNGVHPWWLGIFNAVSAFNNNGMSLLDANMTAFQDTYYVLITMGLLILAGNTCYPIFLRLIIWIMRKAVPAGERWDEKRLTLQYLLDHPRRCYTNLFPSRHTWWLLSAVFVLNGVDWIAFEVLNIGNTALMDLLPAHLRVIDGLFQALAVRSGGFYVVPIPIIRIALQVLYTVMMYISVYPVVITMRNSNVYEERSLGIYSTDEPDVGPPIEQIGPQPVWRRLTTISWHVSELQGSRSYFVRQQVRAQLAHDVWWLVLAVFLIMIIEAGKFENDPKLFSVFNVIFETVSAYGTVGISVGVPYDNYSFCGAWSTLSKLILCAVMLRGRHRGLPVSIDRAVMLPKEALGHAEEADAMIRLERSLSRSRTDPGTSVTYHNDSQKRSTT